MTRPSENYRQRRFISCSLLLAIAALVGCQQTADYRATALPLQWQASSVSRVINPSDFARKSRNSDLVYPGDELAVSVATGIEEQPPVEWTLRVNEKGMIDVPLVGMVHVAGRELAIAEDEIQKISVERGYYVNPNVTVMMKEPHKIRVRVVGEVNKPGPYEIEAAGADLLSALVKADWLTDEADTTIELRHPAQARSGPGAQLASFSPNDAGPDNVSVDLIAAAQGQVSPNIAIRDGTVISVKKRPRDEVYVAGLVRKPNAYPIPSDQPTRVLDMLAKAGDRTLSLANKVHVKRQREDGQSVTIHVPYNEAKRNSAANLVLQPGDVVTVEETPLTFAVETLRSFVRFGFSSTVPNLFQ